MISLRAKSIATATLVIILLAYAIGDVGIKFAGVSPDSNFYGRFIMMGYFAVCATGIGWQVLANRRSGQI